MSRSKKALILAGILGGIVLLIEISLFLSLSFREVIAINFIFIALAAIPIWLFGMIFPQKVFWWGNPINRNRKSISKYTGIQLLVCLIIALILIPKAGDSNHLIEAAVVAVTDGDTFTVKLLDGTEEKVRLLSVDIPGTKLPSKPVQPFGLEATEFTKKFLSDHTIELELDVSERDQYGRLLAYAYLDGKMLNEQLLEKGLARVVADQPNVKYVEQFRAVQKKAQAAKLGIWSIEDYVTDSGYDENAVKATEVPPATAKPTATPEPGVSRTKPASTPTQKPAATKKPAPTKKPVATTKPQNTKKPAATKEPVQNVYYKNCDAVRAAGADPIYAGEPGYSRKLDRDGDGIGCE
jgi:micrococcal nuclease